MFRSAFFAAMILGVSTMVYGNSAVLRLNATGTILPPPQWQDEKDNPIEDIYFDFGGQVAAKDPATNRDSHSAKAKLVNSWTDPARVELERPKRCSIGSVGIGDDHVSILVDAAEVSTDRAINFRRGVVSTMALRFSEKGKYGSASGKVNCQTPGTLTYCY